MFTGDWVVTSPHLLSTLMPTSSTSSTDPASSPAPRTAHLIALLPSPISFPPPRRPEGATDDDADLDEPDSKLLVFPPGALDEGLGTCTAMMVGSGTMSCPEGYCASPRPLTSALSSQEDLVLIRRCPRRRRHRVPRRARPSDDRLARTDRSDPPLTLPRRPPLVRTSRQPIHIIFTARSYRAAVQRRLPVAHLARRAAQHFLSHRLDHLALSLPSPAQPPRHGLSLPRLDRRPCRHARRAPRRRRNSVLDHRRRARARRGRRVLCEGAGQRRSGRRRSATSEALEEDEQRRTSRDAVDNAVCGTSYKRV